MRMTQNKAIASMDQTITAYVAELRSLLYCVVAGAALAVVPTILWRSWAQNESLHTVQSSKGLFDSIMTVQDSCQVTKVFPFRVGCPKQCERQSYPDEPMYRMSLAWYLGMPDMKEGTTYDHGINYQCPVEFVDNFRKAEKEMVAIQKIRDVEIKYQPRMHLSLNYLCCLRRNETSWVREIMYKWILDNNPFSFSVRFDKFQCWHDRKNSVTTIIVADEQSQRTLLKMSNEIEEKLSEKGIPTEVHRTDQMPFHVTLLGVYRGSDEDDPINDITDDIPYIYQIVKDISTTMGSTWSGSHRMLIQHAPHAQRQGTIHAGKETFGS